MTAEYWGLLWQGTLTTLWLTFASGLLSLLLGILVAVARISPLKPLQIIAADYTEFFRNIPLLTVLFFFYFGVPNTGIRLDALTSAILGLGLYTAAYVAEVIRAGLAAISKGNIEASRSLGMTFMQSMRYVQLPQALRSAIPPMGTLLIALLKNTSLASAVAVGDLVYQSDFIAGRTFDPNILLITGAIYLALTLPLGVLFNDLERRWAIKR